MTISTPTWLQAGEYSAKRDRQVIAAMWDEGVAKPRAFKVTQTAGGPTYAVDVAAGTAYVQGDDEPDQGVYLVQSDAVETIAWPAPPASNSRIDVLVLRVNDPNAGGSLGDNATLAVISGTPAVTPTSPTVPDTALVLARTTVAAGQTTITNAQLTDLRIPAGKVEEVGTVKAYSGGPIPSRWILADGVDRVRADLPELHALYESLGYPYGAGNGSTTFGVPNGTGRAVVGAGTGFTIGNEAGAATVTLAVANLPSHTHTGPSHTHTGPSHTHTGPSHTHTGPSHSHGLSLNTQGGGAHSHTVDGAPYWQNIPSFGLNADGTSPPLSGFGTDVIDIEAASNHTHAISGTTQAGGTGATGAGGTGVTGASGTGLTGASGTAATGSTGSGDPVSVMGPHVVVGGWLIRAA